MNGLLKRVLLSVMTMAALSGCDEVEKVGEALTGSDVKEGYDPGFTVGDYPVTFGSKETAEDDTLHLIISETDEEILNLDSALDELNDYGWLESTWISFDHFMALWRYAGWLQQQPERELPAELVEVMDIMALNIGKNAYSEVDLSHDLELAKIYVHYAPQKIIPSEQEHKFKFEEYDDETLKIVDAEDIKDKEYFSRLWDTFAQTELDSFVTTIDLLTDAYSGDLALEGVESAVMTRKFGIIPPLPDISSSAYVDDAFVIEGRKLFIKPYKFAEELNQDGIIPFATLMLNYVVDNGYEYEPLSAYGFVTDQTGRYGVSIDEAGQAVLPEKELIPLHPLTHQPVAEIIYKETIEKGESGEDVTVSVPYLVPISETRRVLQLDISSLPDDVEGLKTAKKVYAVMASEFGSQAIVTALPATKFVSSYQDFSWEVADTSIATVDENGIVMGKALGETTLTITSRRNPDISEVMVVNVIEEPLGAVSLSMLRYDGAELGQQIQNVPACSTFPLKVVANKEGESNSNFIYAWSSDELATGVALDQTSPVNLFKEFASTARFTTVMTNQQLIDEPASALGKVTAQLLGSDLSAEVSLGIVENKACIKNYVVNNKTVNFNFDSNFDREVKGVDKGVNAKVVRDIGLQGHALKVTLSKDATALSDTVGYRMLDWTYANHPKKTNTNLLSHLYLAGDGSAHGKKIKVSMWVKFETGPNNPDFEGTEFTISHLLTPWQVNGALKWTPSRKEGPLFDKTLSALNGEWQYVEFMERGWSDTELAKNTDDADDSATYTIPTTWDIASPVIPEFYFSGLKEGDKVYLDNYAIVEID